MNKTKGKPAPTPISCSAQVQRQIWWVKFLWKFTKIMDIVPAWKMLSLELVIFVFVIFFQVLIKIFPDCCVMPSYCRSVWCIAKCCLSVLSVFFPHTTITGSAAVVPSTFEVDTTWFRWKSQSHKKKCSFRGWESVFRCLHSKSCICI